MNGVVIRPARQVSCGSLVAAIRPAIARFGAAVVDVERRPSRYATSAAIEDLTIELSDGSRLQLLFKDLSPGALLDEARSTRPAFVHHPLREIEVYRRLLTSARLGTAELFGAEADPAEERYWLLLEKVRGVELWQVGDLEVWKEAARWGRRLHEHFLGTRLPSWLIRYDASWYRLWMPRALGFLGSRAGQAVRRLVPAHEQAIRFLSSLPVTLIHGDLYPSNVLIETSTGRVCAVDWERAGAGPGLLDLAALTMGWEQEAVDELAAAYSGRALSRELDLCRLHLCIQWLGWAPQWTPPEEHRRDWLAEAQRLAARVSS